MTRVTPVVTCRKKQLAFARVIPAFGAFGICFGAWYALGALTIVPYVF